MRVLLAWFPDWPAVAAGAVPDQPAAVVRANRVMAATEAARVDGVRIGQRRREAQARCPELAILVADAGRDARAWETAVAAVEALTPSVEVLDPGVLSLATRGPSRYFGGDEALAARVLDTVDRAVGQAGCQVGVADGRFAAGLAARAAAAAAAAASAAAAAAAASVHDRMLVVPRRSSRAWLAPQPVETLGPEFEDLTSLLVRLGIRTLGDLAALPARSVLGRFGPQGAAARRLASGRDERPLAARTPPPDLVVFAEIDPPAQRVDTAAFVAKALADDLHARLGALGLACTAVTIEAETEHGERLERRWRHEGALTATALAERARWQLDGWRASGGLTLLRFTPEEVRPDRGRQLGFWGGAAEADERAARSLARVQGMLDPEAVVTAVLAGGRAPADQVRLVPWGDRLDRLGDKAAEAPWPGRLADPSPAVLHRDRRRADVLGDDGQSVSVSGRGLLSAGPATVSVAGTHWQPIAGWAGPWPAEERWWDAGGRRRAHLQVLLEDGSAHLLAREAGEWWVEATYD